MDKKQLIKLTSTFVTGDGGVYYAGNNCRYVRNQLAKHVDYLLFQQNILEELTSCTLTEITDDRPGRQPSLRLLSKTHPHFTLLRNQIYVDSYKSISPHYLELLDWEVLAYLFQDDGCNTLYTKGRYQYNDITLNLKRLSYGDQLLLKKAIKEKLDIEFNITHGKHYFLRLRAKDTERMLEGVRPYVFDSFKYKLVYPNDWLRNADGEIVRPVR